MEDLPDRHQLCPTAVQGDVQVILKTVRKIEEDVQTVHSSQQRIESWIEKQQDRRSQLFAQAGENGSRNSASLLNHQFTTSFLETGDRKSWAGSTGERRVSAMFNNMPLPSVSLSKDLQKALTNFDGSSSPSNSRTPSTYGVDATGMPAKSMPLSMCTWRTSNKEDHPSVDRLESKREVESRQESKGQNDELVQFKAPPNRKMSVDLRERKPSIVNGNGDLAIGPVASLKLQDTPSLTLKDTASWIKKASTKGELDVPSLMTPMDSLITPFPDTESVGTRHSIHSLHSRQSEDFAHRPAVKRQMTAAYADAKGPKYIKNAAAVQRSSTDRQRTRRSTNWAVPGRIDKRSTEGSRLQKLVLHPTFEVFSASFTLLHALVIASYVEYMASHDAKVHPVLKVSNQILSIGFTLEVMLKLKVEQKHFYVGEEGFWNAFDTVLAVMVIVELVMYLPLFWGDEHRAFVRAFLKMGEIVRTARLLRIFRMLRFSSSLRLILAKIFGSLQTLFWVIILICCLLFVIAVCITQGASTYINDLKEDEDADLTDVNLGFVERNYGSVAKSILTLFKSVTGGNDWGLVADCLMDISFIYAGIFLAYIGFTVFAVLNIVTGVFVDAAMQSSLQERDLVAERQMKCDERSARHLREVFFDMAIEDEGVISNEQFCEFLDDEWVASYMKALKIDTSDANQLFRLLDLDNSGEILIDEFVEGCMKLRGEAKSMDLHIMICEHRRLMVIFRDFVSYAEHQFDDLRDMLGHTFVNTLPGNSPREAGRPASAPARNSGRRQSNNGNAHGSHRRHSGQRSHSHPPHHHGSMGTIHSNDDLDEGSSSYVSDDLPSSPRSPRGGSAMSRSTNDAKPPAERPKPPAEHPFGLVLDEVRDFEDSELTGVMPGASSCK